MLQSQASAACREKDLMDMGTVSHHNQSTVCYERAESQHGEMINRQNINDSRKV
jgi:hypothetical protein